ncbi:MAG: ketopantoate reductase family protein [Halobacteriaceae archaeon]
MHVGVVGGGAMGTLLAARLAAAGTDVTLFDAAPDRARTAREGVHVEGHDPITVPVDATTDPETARRVAVLVVAVKAHDTADAMADADPVYDDETDVVTLQNGLGNGETIAEYVPESNVVAGTTAHGATFLGPGRVRHAGTGPTRIGRPFAPNGERVTKIAGLLTDAGIETSVVADVRDALWRKVAVNAGINAATALADVDNGAMTEVCAGERLLDAAVSEAVAVGRAAGRDLPDGVVAEAREVAAATATNVSSMRSDLRAGKRTEIEAINGELVARGERHGVAVPVNRTLADLVRLAERG